MLSRTTDRPERRARKNGRSGAQSVERAFAVLREIGTARTTGVTAAAIAAELRLNRTTVHRLLKCMLAEGAVRNVGARARYVLGPLAYELGLAAREQLDLHGLFAPALSTMAEKTGDTCFLMMRSGNEAVCIDRKLGAYPIKTLVVDVGTRRPLGVGAGSLAILSALPEDDMRRIVRDTTDRLPAYGITAGAVTKSVRIAQKTGYVSSIVHGVDGVIAVGVPILEPSGNPVAALSIAAIAKRMGKTRQAELVALLRGETARLQKLLTRARD